MFTYLLIIAEDSPPHNYAVHNSLISWLVDVLADASLNVFNTALAKACAVYENNSAFKNKCLFSVFILSEKKDLRMLISLNKNPKHDAVTSEWAEHFHLSDRLPHAQSQCEVQEAWKHEINTSKPYWKLRVLVEP